MNKSDIAPAIVLGLILCTLSALAITSYADACEQESIHDLQIENLKLHIKIKQMRLGGN
jgi:ABC-type lipoprotein release transport system permease subunit